MTTQHLPSLAVVYDGESVSPLDLSAAAKELCHIVWVIDDETADLAWTERLLRRFGSILNIYGMDAAASAALVAQSGVSGIIAFADRQLVRTATIAAELDLAYLTPEVAERLTVKRLQREAMRLAGIPGPQFHAIAADIDADKAASVVAEMRFPLVFKPESGGGSRDTYLIEDAAAMVDRIRALAARGNRESMIAEEYLVGRTDATGRLIGDYVSVEQVTSHGVVQTAGITGRLRPAPPFREQGNFVPAALDASDTQAVLDIAEAAVKAIGITTGSTHTEVKLTPDGPRIIEVNGRVGGGTIPDLLMRVGGESLLRLALRAALGESVRVRPPAPGAGVAYLFAFQPPMGVHRLERVDGVAELRATPGIERVDLKLQAGDRIDWTIGTYNRVFTMMGFAADHDGMLAARESMTTLVHAEYS
jgi:biotin carboxylase